MSDPVPTPILNPTAAVIPDRDRMRMLVADRRRGEAASAEIVAALDPRVIYSEENDPKPVFVLVKGELREVKPQSLYRLTDPGVKGD